MRRADDYGVEVFIDLHRCDPTTFTRRSIRKFFVELCALIDMQRGKLVWWDDLHTPEAERETEAHLVGTSAVQFIKTSNITIHTLDILERVYLNIFSCKDYDGEVVKAFSVEWFHGEIVNCGSMRRV